MEGEPKDKGMLKVRKILNNLTKEHERQAFP
jgi:hypothetical protein